MPYFVANSNFATQNFNRVPDTQSAPLGGQGQGPAQVLAGDGADRVRLSRRAHGHRSAHHAGEAGRLDGQRTHTTGTHAVIYTTNEYIEKPYFFSFKSKI